MNEEKTKEFDEFFKENYKYLNEFSKSINPKNDYKSLVHDVYLRTRTRINEHGYDGHDYLNFTRVALMNLFKSNYRSEKKKTMINIENEDYYQTIEQILLQKEEQNEQENDRQNLNVYLTTMVYDYIDHYYNQKEVFIFRTYYLLKHKHLNYKQLAEATGYSITSVSNIIKKMKKDLRQNLKSYILNGQRINTTSGTTAEDRN